MNQINKFKPFLGKLGPTHPGGGIYISGQRSRWAVFLSFSLFPLLPTLLLSLPFFFQADESSHFSFPLHSPTSLLGTNEKRKKEKEKHGTVHGLL